MKIGISNLPQRSVGFDQLFFLCQVFALADTSRNIGAPFNLYLEISVLGILLPYYAIFTLIYSPLVEKLLLRENFSKISFQNFSRRKICVGQSHFTKSSFCGKFS